MDTKNYDQEVTWLTEEIKLTCPVKVEDVLEYVPVSTNDDEEIIIGFRPEDSAGLACINGPKAHHGGAIAAFERDLINTLEGWMGWGDGEAPVAVFFRVGKAPLGAIDRMPEFDGW